MVFSRSFQVIVAALALAPALAPAAEPFVPPLTPPAAPTPPAGPAPVAPVARERPLHLAVKLGFDIGFTDLLRVKLSDGSTRSIVANQGVFLGVGGAFLPLWDGRLLTEATLGLKYTGVEASNGSAMLLLFPLEILETVRVDPLKLGAGIVYLYRPSMTGKGVLSSFDVGFDSSLGGVVQAEWAFRSRRDASAWSVGPRFVWQRLQVRGGGKVLDANAVGLVVSFTGA